MKHLLKLILKITCRLSSSKTIVVFTHSEALLRCASAIHLLKQGTVVASGTYESLTQSTNLTDVLYDV